MKHFLFFTLPLLFLNTFTFADNQIDWELTGFDMPESVIYDPIGKQLIVSNIDGHPGATNRQGYLSRVSLDGKLLEQKWITGMNAPKGMAIVDNLLYVGDLKEIHRIDLSTETFLDPILVEASVFLNDVTADDNGNVYVSDFMDHKIYKIEGDQAVLWLEDELISHPNGLFADGDTLYVGNWGQGMREDFTTEVAGSLVAVELESKMVKPVLHGETMGNLDGIVRIGNQLLINDWINGKLFTISPDGKKEIGTFPVGLADIGEHNQVVYMPLMLDGKLQAMTYTP